MANLISLLKKSKKEFLEGYKEQKLITEKILSEYGQYIFLNREKMREHVISLKKSKMKRIGHLCYNFPHSLKVYEVKFFLIDYLNQHPGII